VFCIDYDKFPTDELSIAFININCIAMIACWSVVVAIDLEPQSLGTKLGTTSKLSSMIQKTHG
jgi:hypothetical protein